MKIQHKNDLKSLDFREKFFLLTSFYEKIFVLLNEYFSEENEQGNHATDKAYQFLKGKINGTLTSNGFEEFLTTSPLLFDEIFTDFEDKRMEWWLGESQQVKSFLDKLTYDLSRLDMKKNNLSKSTIKELAIIEKVIKKHSNGLKQDEPITAKNITLNHLEHFISINDGMEIISFRSKKGKPTKTFKALEYLWDFKREVRNGDVRQKGSFEKIQNIATIIQSSNEATKKLLDRLGSKLKDRRFPVVIDHENERYRIISYLS